MFQCSDIKKKIIIIINKKFYHTMSTYTLYSKYLPNFKRFEIVILNNVQFRLLCMLKQRIAFDSFKILSHKTNWYLNILIGLCGFDAAKSGRQLRRTVCSNANILVRPTPFRFRTSNVIDRVLQVVCSSKGNLVYRRMYITTVQLIIFSRDINCTSVHIQARRVVQ